MRNGYPYCGASLSADVSVACEQVRYEVQPFISGRGVEKADDAMSLRDDVQNILTGVLGERVVIGVMPGVLRYWQSVGEVPYAGRELSQLSVVFTLVPSRAVLQNTVHALPSRSSSRFGAQSSDHEVGSRFAQVQEQRVVCGADGALEFFLKGPCLCRHSRRLGRSLARLLEG